ncbi:hypothetical protein ACP4OV_013551 [Aristida adscensionis]
MEGAGTRRTTTKNQTVCVTGAGGFVASWLVHRLLRRGGYTVHGTARDPDDAKNAHLAALGGAAARLRLFRADLLDRGGVAAAVAGCDGVFHVASPVPSCNPSDPEVNGGAPILAPTVNVLRACAEAKVKRVVVVSSLSAVLVNPGWPEGKAMDEDCWSDVDYCRATENWYCLSKTLAELEAFDYAKKSGLDAVTVCPSLVIGPLLQSTLNASSSFVVDYLKGDREVKSKLRSFVDVRDVADALLLVYESPEASGRLICNAHQRKVSDVIDLLRFVQVSDNPMFSTKKLEMLGWKFMPLEVTLRDSVESFRAKGILD